MEARKTDIEGLFVLEPRIFRDSRGYFFESFSERDFLAATGLRAIRFVQDNQAQSSYGVVRGLHFQKGDRAQAKLVRVSEGRVLDVAVDLRPGSPTFGRHVAVELSDENFLQFFIPRGFAHGYAVLSETAVFQYKTDNYYCPEAEGSLLCTDPALAIDWRLPPADIILSDKDRRAPLLSDLRL